MNLNKVSKVIKEVDFIQANKDIFREWVELFNQFEEWLHRYDNAFEVLEELKINANDFNRYHELDLIDSSTFKFFLIEQQPIRGSEKSHYLYDFLIKELEFKKRLNVYDISFVTEKTKEAIEGSEYIEYYYSFYYDVLNKESNFFETSFVRLLNFWNEYEDDLLSYSFKKDIFKGSLLLAFLEYFEFISFRDYNFEMNRNTFKGCLSFLDFLEKFTNDVSVDFSCFYEFPFLIEESFASILCREINVCRTFNTKAFEKKISRFNEDTDLLNAFTDWRGALNDNLEQTFDNYY